MELPRSGTVAAFIKTGKERTVLKGYDQAREAFVFEVAARPVDGKANKELLAHLKEAYGLECDVVAGATGRKKLLRLRDI